MKAIHWIIAAAAFAFVQAAQAGVNDPEIIIYRFPGVNDNGGADNTGIATVFFCTNFSGVTENIRFVTRTDGGTLFGNVAFSINHLATKTAATHNTLSHNSEVSLNALGVNQGTTAIAATSTNIICTAMVIDAGALAPIGVALRGIRFSPVPGSQE